MLQPDPDQLHQVLGIVMIGAMTAVRDGSHFAVDVLPSGRSPREAALRLFVIVAIFRVAMVFVVYGWDFAKLGAMQSAELAGLAIVTINIAWPVAGAT